jgi:GMP synthase (glutamine-hydrolysing)
MVHQPSRPNFFVCQQEKNEDLGALEGLLQEAGCETTVHMHGESGDSRAYDPAMHAGLILLGGSGLSATSRTYADEKDWIRQALNTGSPILGICLGAQLLVDVHGERGRVHQGTQEDGEYGWKRVILTEAGKNDPVLRRLAPECEMLLYHQDWCKLSSDTVNSADSESSGDYSEAFRIGTNAYGIQFHPEIMRQMLPTWLSPSGPKTKERAGSTEDGATATG